MNELLLGQDAAVAAWVVERIPHMDAVANFAAIGVARAGALVAGVIYHDYRPSYGGIEISMAASTRLWAEPGTVKALLAYPFRQLNCRWVMTCIPIDNETAVRFNEKLGFVRRAVIPDLYAERRHGAIFTMSSRAYARRFEKG